ncbi:flavodoxin [Litoribacillus peritrichatus]|uniref:Flavodoxin n=1 Tax=Litoribacillus peritrichatus TaxID=718191 RepID=A0ABP7N055_9GAMM
MSEILLVFGTDTGNTEEVAEKIQGLFSEEGHYVELINVSDCNAEKINEADLCIFGIPTWDFGGIQGDWEDFQTELETTNLSGKAIALYGLGDQFGYGDYFIDAVGWLHEIIEPMGANIKGYWPTDTYEFDGSRALSPCRKFFYGLAIDEDQQFELTDDRIKSWVDQLLAEFNLSEAA